MTFSLFKSDIIKGLDVLNQKASPSQIEQLCEFLRLMQEWGRVMNLTSIIEPRQMVARHILDSLSIAPYLFESPILDVGTGAGLPGIPLSIMYPDKKFTLLDKVNKRIQFLRHVKQILGLNQVELRTERVESLTDIWFPCIVSRAFARIDKLIQSSGHLLSERGRILAMTGPVSTEVLSAIPQGWVIKENICLEVPWIERDHFLIWIEKYEQ
ncbi:MAG: 16S rRNA (guanine(527)-N(7))-methyltransferase RsmG [Gammaproteobacteria bacterium]